MLSLDILIYFWLLHPTKAEIVGSSLEKFDLFNDKRIMIEKPWRKDIEIFSGTWRKTVSELSDCTFGKIMKRMDFKKSYQFYSLFLESSQIFPKSILSNQVFK